MSAGQGKAGDPGADMHGAMTVLDVVAAYPATQAVFQALDGRAWACVLCEALFEPLDEVARGCGLDPAVLLADLRRAARK